MSSLMPVQIIMQQDKEHFLNLKSPPARLTAEETGWFLGFSAQEIPILMGEGILKPLGRPARNGPKYFAAAELEELRRDRKWLAKASDAIVGYWHNKNARKNLLSREPNCIEIVQVH
jgi:hypothetical protein